MRGKSRGHGEPINELCSTAEACELVHSRRKKIMWARDWFHGSSQINSEVAGLVGEVTSVPQHFCEIVSMPKPINPARWAGCLRLGRPKEAHGPKRRRRVDRKVDSCILSSANH